FVNEAKFVRALNYFFLVRAFGKVPLVLVPTDEETNLRVPRNEVEQVYTQIIKDLEDASALLNTYANVSQTKGRATGFAAKALLAKVHLYHAKTTNDYTEAARLAADVINEGGFSLPQDFSSVWTAENTSESIFELQFDEQALNTLASVSNPTPSLLFHADPSVIDLYEATDKRRDFTLYQNTDNSEDQRFYIGKYRKFSPATQNFPVIRLAEIYLIHAEAQARVDGSVTAAAYNSYKEVRDRADVVTPIASTFTSVATFVRAVQEEKRLEMMFEGETWFDYVRTELALTELMTVQDKNYFLYPIPDGERLVNTLLDQNPGY
ncbi:MAG: RagB/SusD family nutrient uptake outer membrane protein, partial [Pedobacter sp.]